MVWVSDNDTLTKMQEGKNRPNRIEFVDEVISTSQIKRGFGESHHFEMNSKDFPS